MEAQQGTESMHKNRLFKPDDLLPFPWDNDDDDTEFVEELTDKDIEELQADIDRENAKGEPW
jgi:hypothetical protein